MKTAIHCCFASLMISFGTSANNVPKTVYPFNDGDTVPISLSSININRLMVADDRIINLTCPRGFCTTTGHQKDKSGSISLKTQLGLAIQRAPDHGKRQGICGVYYAQSNTCGGQ
ncbi:hypothetical protein TUMSATVNIG3_56030 (plasmid) [Vibrio nigripulchritudo]|nr:hypothetical protein TUMSATVNIG3_56030 [Vibrio nigripulchritudo]